MSDSAHLVLGEFFHVGSMLTIKPVSGTQDEESYVECSITMVTKDNLIIRVPDNDTFKEHLENDKAVILLLPGYETEVTARLSPKNPLECWLHIPQEIPEYLLQRRRNVRVPAIFPIKIHLPNQTTVQGIAQNISAGGMRFVCEPTFEPDDTFVLEFQPDDSQDIFEMEARTVSCIASPSAAGSRLKNIVSVQFTNVGRKTEDHLVGLCFRLELRKRHVD